MLKFILVMIMACSFVTCAQQTGSQLLNGLGMNSKQAQEELTYSCAAKPPPARPAQFSGGEGVPPLPLPAVPLRRSEKKNPPQPPVLAIKVITDGGMSDWNTNPSDMDNLLRWMAENMNVHFSTQNKTMEDIFSYRSQVRLAERK